MPLGAPQWTDILLCPLCCKVYNSTQLQPISLGCGHNMCKLCVMGKLHQRKCPFDQFQIAKDVDELAINAALLFLVGDPCDVRDTVALADLGEFGECYVKSGRCIVDMAAHLRPMLNGNKSGTLSPSTLTNSSNGTLSRPMQRKLVALISCQLVEEEGRSRALRAARSLGERSVTELILQHQNQQQLSANLWAAVRGRGCQFLGPAMQEEVLKLILLALEDGSSLSRKVLVLYVVQKLEGVFSQASKTAIGHVVQLLYRASCFKVTKRDGESSLMELKEEFRSYDSLRREHDSQIVQIAIDAGLRIAPDQWSSLLYGDSAHKSHMQSIIDKLQTPGSFSQSIVELMIALQRTKATAYVTTLNPHLETLAKIDSSPDSPPPSWETLTEALVSARVVVDTMVKIISTQTLKKVETPAVHNAKYKTSMCRDITRGVCPRGTNCTFAHTPDELEKFRVRSKKYTYPQSPVPTAASISSSMGIDAGQTMMSPHSRCDSPDGFQAYSDDDELGSPLASALSSNPVGPSAGTGSDSPTTTTPRHIALITPRMMTCEVPTKQFSARGYAVYPPDSYQRHQAALADDHNDPPLFERPTTPDSALKGLRQRRDDILAKLQKSTANSSMVKMTDVYSTAKQDLTTDPSYSLWSSGLDDTSIRAVVTPVIPRMMSEPTYTTNRVRNTNAGRHGADFLDSFIPFDPPIVSKFGPIARLKDSARFKLTEPVQAVSSQAEPIIPVTAVTPSSRPFMSPSPVPSMYTCIQGQAGDIVMDPYTGQPIPGNKIAHVVPVAQLHTKTVTTSSKSSISRPAGPAKRVTSIAEREQLKLELTQVNQKIDKLSEYSLLTHELQRVERSIFKKEQLQLQHPEVYTGHPNLCVLNEGHRFPSVADIGPDFSNRYAEKVNVTPNPGMYTQMPAPVPPSALSDRVYHGV